MAIGVRWFFLLVTCGAISHVATPAASLSPDDEKPVVGSREGRSLTSYESIGGKPIAAWASLQDVADTLGAGVDQQTCAIEHDITAPCLMQGVIVGDLRTIDVYLFPNDELRYIVTYITPATETGTWFQAPPGFDWPTEWLCRSLGDKLLKQIVAKVGSPDPTTSAQLYADAGERFPTTSTSSGKRGGGYRFSSAAARFSFTNGSSILFEREFNKDDDECRVRQILEFEH